MMNKQQTLSGSTLVSELDLERDGLLVKWKVNESGSLSASQMVKLLEKLKVAVLVSWWLCLLAVSMETTLVLCNQTGQVSIFLVAVNNKPSWTGCWRSSWKWRGMAGW